jgi:BirA family biotin operon repressor/biotin-[acetyl-CoA-carboxylase] ligase
MFTLCLPGGGIARPPEALPLRVALGTSWFLREAGYRGIAVKWPNDVLVSGRKICGILCHHVADWFLVGVGLNVNQRSFPADLRRPATSLVLEGAAASRTGAAASRPGATASRPGATAGADGSGPPEIDAQSLLEPLLGAIARALDTGPWREELLPLLAGIGEEVQIAGEAPDYPALGLVIGIDQGGALLVQLHESGRVEAVYSRDRLEWRKKI